MMGMCQQMMGNMMNGKGRMGMGPMGMMRWRRKKTTASWAKRRRALAVSNCASATYDKTHKFL